MDGGLRQSRVRFSGVGQEDQGSGQAMAMPPQRQRGTPFGRGEEYDAAYAATVAAVAYAIAAMEEEKLPPQQKPIPEKTASRQKRVTVHEPTAAPPPRSPPRRGGSMKRPTEGSKISRLFSGNKEIVEVGDEDEQGANVSVRRPVKPAPKKPGGPTPGQNVVGKVVDSVPNLKDNPSFTRKTPDKKRSRNFEQEEANQRAKPGVNPTTSFPGERKQSWKHEQEPANQRAPPAARPPGMVYSSEAERMAAAWEKEELAKIKERYNETMETIAEWETEKKAKARRQKEPKEGDSERKRAKALEEYNDEMKRISKVAAASRLSAEDKKRNAEGKVWEKAAKIRSTGKLPRSCGCF
ncbi:remorin-like [Triticum dicoccoides]|uniref:remorin-like n=1 Tax=Triticum dicoccoides TaxID=85692 RepID=UPI00162DA212|nr:remorin-like [Triticum dicoccoides]